MRPGADRNAHIEGAAARDFAIPVEQLDSLAVDQDFELLATNLTECGGAAHVAFVDWHDFQCVLTVAGNW